MRTDCELYLATWRGRAYIISFERRKRGRPRVRVFREPDPDAPELPKSVVARAIARERGKHG